MHKRLVGFGLLLIFSLLLAVVPARAAVTPDAVLGVWKTAKARA